MNRKVAVIILNWNSWSDTIECLESVLLMNYQDYVTIIVDNGSSDKSIENLKEFVRGKLIVESKFFEPSRSSPKIAIVEYARDQINRGDMISNAVQADKDTNAREPLVLLRNERNYGFAEGNNIGIRFALDVIQPDYILLLNSDTVVDPDFLLELVRIGDNDERIAALGPKVSYYHDPSKINSAGCEMHYWSGFAINVGTGEMDNGQFSDVREVDCVQGCAFLIKASAFHDIGLLDPDFFLLLEDTDWCLRARKAGYKILFVPTAQIYHKEGFAASRECNYYYYRNRNRILLLKKHQTSLRKAIYGLSITLRTLAGSIILSIEGAPNLAICGLNGYFNGLRIKK